MVEYKISVIGQGYVGLPLAMASVSAGMEVIGIDKNKDKVKDLNQGIPGIEDIKSDTLLKALQSKNYKADSEAKIDSDVSIIAICVPTPLGKNHQPDLTILKSAAKDVGKNLKKGCW